MSIITLTSDYGQTDFRAAAIRGRILSLKNDAKIINISHNIQSYNLLQTAYIVRNAYPFFPKGTVHLIAVDSFYHKDRKLLIFKADGHFFIAADNGIASLIFYDQKPESVYEITINNRFDDVVNFTATDVFAPAAVHLSSGGIPEVVGRKTVDYKRIVFSEPKFSKNDKILVGEVIYIDHFGNCITNISKSYFEKIAVNFENFTIKVRSTSIKNIYGRYTDVVSDWEKESDFFGKISAVFNLQNLLEITVYKGSKSNGASSLLGLKAGDKILIEF